VDAEPEQAARIERSGGRPVEQVTGLLGRAENAAQAARHLAEARSALMHSCGLQSCRHAKGPPRRLDRRTYRHSFLLPDGSVRVLWELEHNTGPGDAVRYAVFTDREDLALAEWGVDAAFGVVSTIAELPPPALLMPLGSLDGTRRDLDEAVPPPATCRRAYTEGDSAEHAWRLLRRATNPGAPGPEVRARLRAAIAHDISIVTRRSALVGGRLVSWSLYEHAFLLLDGSELSLWEIDHTRTPSGVPVCEVYASQDAALDSAVRRIEG